MKYYVDIIGCQQNEHDGIRINYLLKNSGFLLSNPDDADLIVIVACAVRQTAVDRVFGRIKNWKGKTIIVTGCVLKSDQKKLKAKGVGFWNIEKPEELARILKLDRRKTAKLLNDGKYYSFSIPIMFGCNNFCTYCATALTRGRERSRKLTEIISDATRLIKNGAKEIILLGQTVNSYKDPETGAQLNVLLEKINNLEGDFEISFLSNHPKDMSDKIIDAVAKLPKVKKEIHLPLQSGSDKILKAMNRPYSAKQYLEVVENCKLKIKNLRLTTDVIVGFPGETEKDFQKTVGIFKKVKYHRAYINKYSPRKGTAAFALGDPIPWNEKKRRWHILNNTLER